MIEKIKTDVNRLLLVLTMEKNCPICFSKNEPFLNFETKYIFASVFIFFEISEILRTKFYALWTQTEHKINNIC